MKQRIYHITYSRDVHKRPNNKIGVLTYYRIEEEKKNGKLITRSQNCSYTVQDAGCVPVAKKQQIKLLTERRAA